MSAPLSNALAKVHVIRGGDGEGERDTVRIYRPASSKDSMEGASTEGATGDPSETLLADGDALLADGNLRGAAELYFEIVNDWPESAAAGSLDNVINALAWDAERDRLDPADLRVFTDSLPAYGDCHSDKALYWAAAAEQITGEAVLSAGDRNAAREYLTKGRDMALMAMTDLPDSPYQIFFPGHYIRSCRLLGKQELRAGVSELKSTIRQQRENNILKFASRQALAVVHHLDYNDALEGGLQCADILDEFPNSVVERELNENALTGNVAAHIRFALGYVHYQMSHFGTARRYFTEVAEAYPDNLRIADAGTYMSAYLLDLAHADDTERVVGAYSGYLEAFPEGAHVEATLFRLAGVFERTGNLTGALNMYRQAVSLFPEASWAGKIAQWADETQAAIEAGMETQLYIDRLRATYGGNLCGSYALALMLDSRGISVDFVDVVENTERDASGTTMASLQASAQQLGLSLRGVRVADVAGITAPSIAHVAPNHFVFVRAVDGSSIEVEDFSGVRRLDLDAARGLLSGFLLIPGSASSAAETVTSAILRDLRGGCDEFFEDLNEAYMSCINQDYVPDCPDCDTGDMLIGSSAGTINGEGACPIGNGPPGPPPDVQTNALIGAMGNPGRPTMQPNMGFNRSGVTLGMGTNHRAVTVKQTDISTPTRGALSLDFRRFYYNPWGSPRGYNWDPSRPFKENLGCGWSHNFNAHLRVSSQGGFVYYIDAYGNYRHFTRNATDQGGYDIYGRTPTGMEDEDTNTLTRERAVVLKRSVASGWFELEFPNGNVSHFSAPIDAEELYCRAEWHEDASGNRFTLTYAECIIDGTDWGRLSRVDTPTGDDRYLTFTYTGNMISTVELRKDATQSGLLKQIDYDYDVFHTLGYGEQNPFGSDFLRSVTTDDDVDDVVAYEYDGEIYDQNTYRAYPSKITDKEGNELLLSFEYDQIGGENFTSTSEITITYPNGLSTVFDKIASYTTDVRNYDGQTALSRFTYFLGPHGVRVDNARYYKNPGDGTYVNWGYTYDNTFDLTNIAKVSTQYSYNDDGRVTRESIGGVYYRYEYPAGGGLYPEKRYGPGVLNDAYKGPLTEYTYDGSGRITNVKPPNMGSNGITYTYDNYGQVTQRTNPDSSYESFTYDTRGNLTSHTDFEGNTWSYEYDDEGRMIEMTDPEDHTTTYTYTGGCPACGGASGQISSITDAEDHTTEFEYDNNGNLVLQTDPMGRETHYTYDSMNHVTEVETNDGRTQSYTYDKLGRLVSTTDFDGKVVKHEYDYRGLVTKTWIENDPGTTNDDDVLVENVYDDAGHLTAVTDGKDQTISFTYNNRGQVTWTSHGDAYGPIHLQNTYDTYGRLYTTSATTYYPTFAMNIDPTEYTYNDTTGQLTRKRMTNGAVVKDIDYYYDTLGRVSQLDDWMDGTNSDGHHFAYDDNGQVTTYTDFDDATLTQTYDDLGRPSAMSAYEEGNDYGYTYTDAGRIATITAPGGREWEFSYNDAGQPMSYTWPNGMSTEYSYDTAGRLTKIEHKDGSTVKAGWSYGLDEAGNILRMASTVDGSDSAWEYGYDARDRLISALRRNVTGTPRSRVAYSYDDGDNLLTKQLIPYVPKIVDRFEDGDYTVNPAWSVSEGTWQVSGTTNKYLENTGSGCTISRANTSASFDLRFSYYRSSASSNIMAVLFRFVNSANYCQLVVDPSNMRVQKKVGGVWTTLDTNTSLSHSNNTWYDIRIVTSGANADIWWGPQGAPLEHILETDSLGPASTNSLLFKTLGGAYYRLDDIHLCAERSTASSLADDFNDGNYTGWSIGGGYWSAVSNAMVSTSATAWTRFYRSAAFEDGTLDYAYRITDVDPVTNRAAVWLRRDTDSGDGLILYAAPNKMELEKTIDGVPTMLATNTNATSSVNQWYNVRAILDGEHVEVWRGAPGQTMTFVFSTESAGVLRSTEMRFADTAGLAVEYDNIVLDVDDPELVEFTYGAGNQLASMTAAGLTTEFTYDAHGRLIERSVEINQQEYTATYEWRFGDKLKRIDSTIPGETPVVQYNYDGLGKRRIKVANGHTTWWRWGLGWDPVTQYDEDDDDWAIEGFSRLFVPYGLAALAEADVTTTPANASYNYLGPDHLGSGRSLFNQAKTAVGAMEHLPYGTRYAITGTAPYHEFTGKPWDGESGKYYFLFRDYDPDIARWIAPDPIGLVDGANVYGYASERPVRLIDILGLSAGADDERPPNMYGSFIMCALVCAATRIAAEEAQGTACTVARATCNAIPDGQRRRNCRREVDQFCSLAQCIIDFAFDECIQGCKCTWLHECDDDDCGDVMDCFPKEPF